MNAPVPPAGAPAARRALMMLDAAGRIERCSRRAAGLFGRAPERLLGWPIQALLPSLPLQQATPGYNAAFATFWHGEGSSLPLWGIHVEGERIALDVGVERIDSAGCSAGIALVLRRRPAAAGRASAASDLPRYLATLAHRSEGIVVTDRRGTILHMNPACERLIGRTQAQSRGAALRDLVQHARAAEHWVDGRVIWTRSDPEGRRVFLEPSMRPFVDRASMATHHVYTLRDISDSVTTHQRLIFLAQHDSLTGLPNRALFNDRLQRELARFTRHGIGFSLLVLDIDQFKAINDRYGHEAGDQVLLRVAQRLARSVRDEDTVARLGGDEFAIILSGSTQPRDVAVAIDAMLSALGAPLRLFDGTTLWPSASVGVARCPADAAAADALARLADAAMYRAKRAGGQRAHFGAAPLRAVPKLQRPPAPQPQHGCDARMAEALEQRLA